MSLAYLGQGILRAGAGRLRLLDELVRDGARQMLAAALQAEAAAYIDAHAGVGTVRAPGRATWTSDHPREGALLHLTPPRAIHRF